MTNRAEIMRRLWDRMTHIYGKQWESNYGHIDGQAFKTWAAAMDEFSPQQIKRGLDALSAEGSEFAPNLIKFCRLCRTAPPSYHQAAQKSLPKGRGSFRQYRLACALSQSIFGGKLKPMKHNNKFINDWTEQDEQELKAMFSNYRGEALTQAIQKMTVLS